MSAPYVYSLDVLRSKYLGQISEIDKALKSTNESIIPCRFNSMTARAAVMLFYLTGVRRSVRLEEIAIGDWCFETGFLHLVDKKSPNSKNGRLVAIPSVLNQLLHHIHLSLGKHCKNYGSLNDPVFPVAHYSQGSNVPIISPLSVSMLEQLIGKLSNAVRASVLNAYKAYGLKAEFRDYQAGHNGKLVTPFTINSSLTLYEIYSEIRPSTERLATDLECSFRKSNLDFNYLSFAKVNTVKHKFDSSLKAQEDYSVSIVTQVIERLSLKDKRLLESEQLEQIVKELKLSSFSHEMIFSALSSLKDKLSNSAKKVLKRFKVEIDELPLTFGNLWKFSHVITLIEIASRSKPHMLKYLFLNNLNKLAEKETKSIDEWIRSNVHLNTSNSFDGLKEFIHWRRVLHEPGVLSQADQSYYYLRSLKVSRSIQGLERSRLDSEESMFFALSKHLSCLQEVGSVVRKIISNKSLKKDKVEVARHFLMHQLNFNEFNEIQRVIIKTYAEHLTLTASGAIRFKISTLLSYANIFNYENYVSDYLGDGDRTEILNKIPEHLNIRHLFERCFELYFDDVAPSTRQSPQSSPSGNVLTYNEYSVLLSYLEKRYQSSILILFIMYALILARRYGLRRSEVLNLYFNGIVSEDGFWIVILDVPTKSSKGRRYVTSQLTKEEVMVFIQMQELSKDKNIGRLAEWCETTHTEVFDVLTELLRFITRDSEFRFHDLRRSLVNERLYNAALGLINWQELEIGHSDLSTSLRSYSVDYQSLTEIYRFNYFKGWSSKSLAYACDKSDASIRKSLSRSGLPTGQVSYDFLIDCSSIVQQPIRNIPELGCREPLSPKKFDVISTEKNLRLGKGTVEAYQPFEQFLRVHQVSRKAFNVSIRALNKAFDHIEQGIAKDQKFLRLLKDDAELILMILLAILKKIDKESGYELTTQSHVSELTRLLVKYELVEVNVRGVDLYLIRKKSPRLFAFHFRAFVCLTYLIERMVTLKWKN